MIKEISRLSDLDDDGIAVVTQAMITYNANFKAITDEIRSKVIEVPTETANDSALWYPMAHDFATNLSDAYGVSVEVAAGVIAAVSPRMPWLRNKIVAETIIREVTCDDTDMDAEAFAKKLALGMSSNVVMAINIIRGEGSLTGIKRKSFYNNIVDPYGNDSVTVDTWMLEAYVNASGKDKATALKFVRANEKVSSLNGTGVGYIVIAECVRNVAKELGMTANAVQAVYWCALSGSINGGRTDIGS